MTDFPDDVNGERITLAVQVGRPANHTRPGALPAAHDDPRHLAAWPLEDLEDHVRQAVFVVPEQLGGDLRGAHAGGLVAGANLAQALLQEPRMVRTRTAQGEALDQLFG